MTMTDPLADMLTRMRNALQANHGTVDVPWSKMRCRIAEILRDEGYIGGFVEQREGTRQFLHIQLKYGPRGQRVIHRLHRVSSPGRRVYASADEIPSVMGGLGIAILSTPRGVMTDAAARSMRVGGEVLCFIE
jgi:small subunit ribosomal protein S8